MKIRSSTASDMVSPMRQRVLSKPLKHGGAASGSAMMNCHQQVVNPLAGLRALLATALAIRSCCTGFMHHCLEVAWKIFHRRQKVIQLHYVSLSGLKIRLQGTVALAFKLRRGGLIH
eukprot:CAMPEP_0178438404 /NCGR_PEP_ID=MMETSP0689_2-20121128/35574_1 /TAXON_ID=160604 /ORGANISM="Amphidinium massartii, Strain CS-259" /LENGTH=116 /DNA_ID=CAMNT_0020060803 /DNA_START=40 /DNA_END=390 /DNA_ORIENTATION=+